MSPEVYTLFYLLLAAHTGPCDLTLSKGFQNAAVPVLNKRIASDLVGYLPATVIVLLIEHIAVSKSLYYNPFPT